MSTTFTLATALIVLSMSGVAGSGAQVSGKDVYQWHGELVSFDAGSKMATVKSRLVDLQAAAPLRNFKAGDRVVLTWSGYERYADGIRSVAAYSATRSADDRFLLAVELVSTDTPNQYLTFRIRVPDASVAAVTRVKPGEWITVTAAHRAARDAEAIVAVAPYVSSPSTSTE